MKNLLITSIVLLNLTLICFSQNETNEMLNNFNESIKKGDLNEVKNSIPKIININEIDKDGYSPLLIAILNNKVEILELLISKQSKCE
ncbi:MAG: ankyrin repeat domain-containing protein [Candidatus Kapabacteria bacterium]|nr:ankyrin repeat domain-containing protein [Candidatus Kapabacteria bacterium]